MHRKLPVHKELQTSGSKVRGELSRCFWFVRRADAAGGHATYKRDRRISEVPFREKLVRSVETRAGKGRIAILDKGAGAGKVLAYLKNIAPDRINTTAISLSNEYDSKAVGKIDKRVKGFGVRTAQGKRFDIIYDCYGEDYFLPKRLIEYSIEKTISDLKRGGEAFTIIPLVYVESEANLTVMEGRAIVQKLLERRDIKTEVVEVKKRFEKKEYVDMIMHITKN